VDLRAAATGLSFVTCLPDPPADLAGPRVVASSLPEVRAVEVGVRLSVSVRFSEAMDPATLSGRHVALVRWEEVGTCALSPVCERGICDRGRCWADPLRQRDLAALADGTWEPTWPLELELVAGPAGPDRQLEIRSPVPLEPWTRWSLIVGAGARDRGGAALEGPGGEVVPFRRELSTAGEGSSGPQPRLVRPAEGTPGTPTNLRAIDIAFAVPLGATDGATLELVTTDGGRTELSSPEPCAGWVAGTCLRFLPVDELAPGTSFWIAGGTLVDTAGRGVVPDPRLVLHTGPGPDLDAPDPGTVEARRVGGCVVVSLDAPEPWLAQLEVGEASTRVEGEGPLELALRPGETAPDTGLLRIEDLAGNERLVQVGLGAGPVGEPALAITEVLANPAGPEPHQEFVELHHGGTDPVELAGLRLADLPWSAVELELASGAAPGDPLAGDAIEPGETLLIVAAGYDPAGTDDVAPAVGTRLVTTDASLGNAGLRNAGEWLTLYRVEPPAVLATYGNFVDTAATDHAGRSVAMVRADACDVAASWRSHPSGRATPGLLP
jgi:hypothetical protein